ncbi:TIR domain-containing protein [Streptomyces sp. H27-S2]|uniref:TIR domain-containing protein n=1 Tax=Streptomyces antarcticus TaxID=2996458 RepID=UPI0022704D5C|nr:TIR domain-containing protein [Streptomyces sp. H27-S2]MCY0954377.1 TIR domain-containing protein [Streptomyces sp. H27-S2]
MDHERDAFISYSHKRDVPLAQGIQRGLQRLARPWTRRQVINVFRDTTSLSANSDLGGSIMKELERSRYFIYLASPEAAQSRWVREEIHFWITHRPVERLLIAVSGGTLVWDNATGDFDWDVTTALPPILRGAFRTEPLWVDLTAFRTAQNLSLRHAEFRDAVATLAAPLHGRTKDELDGEDLRQHRLARRFLRGAVITLSALLAISLVAGLFAWQQRGEAIDRAERSASQALAARALEIAETDPRRAAQLALYAEAVQPTSESAQAMARAVGANEGVARHFEAGRERVSDYRGAGTVPNAKVAISPDGSTLAYYVDFDEVAVYDIRTGTSLQSLPTQGPQNGGALEFSSDGGLLMMETAYNQIQLWDAHQARLLRTISASDGRELSNAFKRLQGHALSADGRWLAATYYTPAMDDEHLGVWDTGTGDVVMEGPAASNGLALAFDGSNQLVTFAGDTGTVRNYTPASKTWGTPRSIPALKDSRGAVLSPRGERAYVLGGKASGKDELWDLITGKRIAELADRQPTPASSTGTRSVAMPSDTQQMMALSDGQSVVTYDSALRRQRALGSFTWPVLTVATSSDGTWVAAAAENGAVSLFAARIGQGGENLPNEDQVKPDELTPTRRVGVRLAGERTELWTVGDGDSGIQRAGSIARKVAIYDSNVTVNADGSRAALTDGTELSLWDPRTGAQVGPVRTVDGLSDEGPMWFMPDGVHVVLGVSGRFLLLDSRSWETRQDLGEFKDPADAAQAGAVVAVMSGDDVTVWRWTGDNRLERTHAYALGTHPVAFALSHDAGRVAVIDGDRVITIIDVETGRKTTSSAGMQYGDSTVVFSRDSRLLMQRVRNGASSGIHFWDTASGDAVGSWPVPGWTAESEETIKLFSGPGGNVLSLREDGTFARHAINFASWHEILCSLAPEPLSQGEYDRYLKDLEVSAPCRPQP